MTTATLSRRTTRRRPTAATPEPSQNGYGRPIHAPEPLPVEPVNPVDANIEQTAETILKDCSKVRVRNTKFGTSAKIDDDTLTDMIDAPKTVKAAISVSKRLMKSKHPALVAVNQAFQAIDSYVHGMTIPLVAIHVSGGSDTLRKDGGVRVIQKKDMAEFDARMTYLKGILETSAQSLHGAMEEIKREDKERLDALNPGLFKDDDYPSDVRTMIGCDWTYEPIGLDADWKTLCPEIYERESIAARRKCEAVVENAAVEFARTFVSYVEQVMSQLGCRTRLNPPPGHERRLCLAGDQEVLADIKDAEVVELRTHANEPDIPAGEVLALLRLKTTGKGRSTEVWMKNPVSQDRWEADYRPYETTEKRKIYDSTVDNLKSQLETFLRVGDLLGPYKAAVTDSVTKVKEILSRGSSSLDTTKIATELREGTYFRSQLKTTLQGVASTVRGAMKDVVAQRRSLMMNLVEEI